MEQDFTQQEGLDSSILNSGFLGGGNRPIGRGKRVKFRRRALPFYYGANGEMVMMAEPVLMEQSLAPQQVVEYAQPAPQQVVEYAQPAPQQVVEYVQPATQQVVEQSSPVPVLTPVIEQVSSPAPTENYIPNNNVVIAEALPPQNFNQPIIAETYSAPIVMATTPTQTQTPTQFSTPIVAQTNIPSQPTTTTSTSSTSTTTAPKPVVTGGGMPMGGGGGGVAPASKPASTTTTTTVKAPNGVVQQKTTTTTFEKQGMSKGMKFGIVALLVVGGYFAYKNRAKLGFK
jgi:hypothetical protein